MSRRPFARPLTALGITLLLPLAACGSKETDKTAAAAPASDGTLASVVTRAPGLAVVSGGLKWTGLANVFDGAAPYTLLAPDDDAFGAMGPAGSELQQPENAAAMADILRDHILPGYVTPADIDAALKASNGEAVRMKTMGDTEVSFDREGEALVVTAPDGARARIEGSALTASNGVVIPLDSVLRKLPAG
jgi:uncharacterized surface protein with fasciclin (FAS1) repeats